MIEKARIKVARELARNLIKKAGIDTAPIWLNRVVPILEVEVAAWKFDDKLDGIQIHDGKEAFIGFKDDNPVVRKRSTVAHEMGHFMMGHVDPNNLDRLEYIRDKIKENEAWLFARELLMPIKMFKEAFDEDFRLNSLARKFWVSEQMASIRMSELGLLNKIPV